MRKYRDNFDPGEEVFKNITDNFRQIAWYSMHRIRDNLRINTTVTTVRRVVGRDEVV